MKSVCETGIIREVRGPIAVVRLTGEPGCRKCGLKELGLCKTGGAGVDIEARLEFEGRPGQRVRVLRGGTRPSEGGFVLYGLPAGALLLGALAGERLARLLHWSPDAGAVLVGFSLLAAAVAFSRAWGRRQERSGRFLPSARKLEPWEDPARTEGA